MRQHHSIAAAVLMLAAMALAEAVHAAPTVSNGGAQYWVAFDPNGRTLGNAQFLTKRIVVLNTSSATNTFTIYYEPQHTTICTQTLAAGGMTTCGLMSTPAMVNGYFQVIAAAPVLVGGSSDTPFMNFTQDAQGNFGADPSHGAVISVPFDWREGCPPRPGTGCPDGITTAAPTGVINRDFQAR
jgi:hypothetical protein